MKNPFGNESKVTNPFDKSNDKEEKERIIEETKDIKTEIDSMLIGIDETPVAPVKVIKTRKQAILESYGGLESNVPINSPYWKC